MLKSIDVDIVIYGYHEFYLIKTKEEYLDINNLWEQPGGPDIYKFYSFDPDKNLPCIIGVNYKDPWVHPNLVLRRFDLDEFKDICIKNINNFRLASEVITESTSNQ